MIPKDEDESSQPWSGLVLYGSETGNALDYAEEIGRMLGRIHFQTHVSPLDQAEPVRGSLSFSKVAKLMYCSLP